jgi:hypothetical protein
MFKVYSYVETYSDYDSTACYIAYSSGAPQYLVRFMLINNIVCELQKTHQGCGSYWTKGSYIQVAIMTWLTVTEYLCHSWPQICSVSRNHNHDLFHDFSMDFNKSNKM